MMKTAVNDKVNEALFVWFTQCRSKGLPVSGPILQEKLFNSTRKWETRPNLKPVKGSWKSGKIGMSQKTANK